MIGYEMGPMLIRKALDNWREGSQEPVPKAWIPPLSWPAFMGTPHQTLRRNKAL